MIKIKHFHLGNSVKYLWLKGVDDVDLTKHCARCLIGEYSKIINKTIINLHNKEIDIPKSKAYYLCGVTEPFRYKDNFHLAFEEREGEVLKVYRNGISVEIQNAVEIPFSINDIDKSLPQSNRKEFYTCRNWQFANKFKKLQEQKI